METHFGFKKLTQENWLEPDEVTKMFVRLTPGGQTAPITGSNWLASILQPQLAASVPDEIKKLFEVARSAMAYGYFFYPLYTLASDQCYRVVEAAIIEKCRRLRIPKKFDTFEKKIKWLVQQGVIEEQKKGVWDAVRYLRNVSSHPKDQQIRAPGPAITTLHRCAEDINALF
jgi:hypothetical protein